MPNIADEWTIEQSLSHRPNGSGPANAKGKHKSRSPSCCWRTCGICVYVTMIIVVLLFGILLGSVLSGHLSDAGCEAELSQVTTYLEQQTFVFLV